MRIMLDQKKDEPESFLLPPDIRSCLDEYFKSKVFIADETPLLKEELARSRERLNELENELAKASAVNKEAEHYARNVERELQRKSDALEEASQYVERVDQELAVTREQSISLSGELEAARARIGALESALSQRFTRRLLGFLRSRMRKGEDRAPGAP